MKAGNQICTQLTMKLFYLIKPLAAAHIESNEDINTEILPGMQEETGSKCLAAKGSGTLLS
jgi:hypothetical protein